MSLCHPTPGCHPSPHAFPARSLSTIDPTPARCSSTAVIIAAILASLGAALAVAMLGAVGYEWGMGILRLFFFHKSGGLLYFGNGMGWFLRCLSCMDPA